MKDGFKKPLAVVLSAMLMSSASLTTLPTFTAMALDDIGTNGILKKKYTSSQEITNVIMTNSLGIVIYKDRIEIISF